jgi:hypothetical protein
MNGFFGREEQETFLTGACLSSTEVRIVLNWDMREPRVVAGV